ncbi:MULTISPECIES: MFS transporter [unclassified Adlercreutzia]|uniref:MFS transporter n=1 Tax=unclassified Adlercreutzia TaxID=2636013 RepID=UPI0013EA156A|nr:MULTISPECIES: MFS transporter [unclassified Adlercreutzia]
MGRKTSVAIGVTIILASASGGTAVMNAIVPFLLAGMKVDLATFMIGPMIATILSFVMSVVGIKVIDIIGAKWCMLIGSCCSGVTMYMVGTATSFPLWIVANILNGIVLAVATYASAGGVLAPFWGKDTQKAFGVVGGVTALLGATWIAVTGILLTTMPYQTLFTVYAVGIVVIGLFCNFVLIGKVPRKAVASGVEKSAGTVSDVPGFTFAETLKKGASIYCFLIAMFFVAWCASGITSYASVYYTSFGMAATTAALLMSVYSYAAAILKLASGFLVKKLGAKVMSICIYLGFALGMICLLLWSQTGLLPLAFIGMVLCAFISYSTMIPGLFVPDLYGMKDYTGINSGGIAGYYLGAVFVLGGLSFVIGALGYFNSFLLLAVASLVAMAFMLTAVATAPMKKLEQEEGGA